MMQASRYNPVLFKKVANIWLAFNALLMIASYLPHWPVPFGSWVNLSLYFLAFLITVYIVKADQFNRDIYIPFCILFFLYSCPSFLIIFTGKGYIVGSDRFSWIAYRQAYLGNLFFFAYSIVYFVLKSALKPRKPYVLTAATLVFVAAVFAVHFHSLILDPLHQDYDEIFFAKKFTYYLLPTSTLFIYGLLNPFLKPRHGQYSHAIMSVLAFLSLREFALTISVLKSIYLFGIDQIFLTSALVSLNVILFKKLSFVSSVSGKVYSQILNDNLYIPNLKLEGREKKEFAQFAALVYYIYLRKNVFIPVTFVLLLAIKMLNPPSIVSLNLIFIGLLTLLVAIFLIVTYNRKQKKDGYIITINKHITK